MSKDYTNASFKKLLEKLQEESWQLELLISGFAIFGLFTAYQPIKIAAQEAQNDEKVLVAIILTVTGVSCAILICNLLLHVILRGLWIGALGLRYVSGDIDYDTLKYSPKFTKYLQKKIGSFDKYIGNLENYCSVIFAISFLLIFYVIAFTLTMAAISLVSVYLIDDDAGWESPAPKVIGIVMVLFIVIGMLLTFFDFITQGWLKKKQWVSKIYFPIYWVFSFITLSFLYRPLVYNFLDNKFGRRLSFVLVPIYFVILIMMSLKYEKSNYLSIGNNSSALTASDRNYENLLDVKKGEFIKNVAIQSKVITDPYLKLFMPYTETMEDRVFKRNKGLKPKKDARGLSSDITFSNNFDFLKRDSLRIEYMKTINTIYKVKIDSTFYDAEFILGHSLGNQFGFETYLSINNLTKGKHVAIMEREYIKDKDTTLVRFATIPFWYFKD